MIRTDSRGRPLCEGLTKRRRPCLDTAMPGSPFCEMHDPSGEGLRSQIQRSRTTLIREAFGSTTPPETPK